MSFEPTKVIEMNKGKQIGNTLMQDASNIPYNNTNVKDELDTINSNLTANKSLSSDSTALILNTVFAVPSDGYIVIQTLSGKVTKLYCVDDSNTNIEFSDFNNASNDALNSSVFVKKGMKLIFASSSTSGSAVFKPLV